MSLSLICCFELGGSSVVKLFAFLTCAPEIELG